MQTAGNAYLLLQWLLGIHRRNDLSRSIHMAKHSAFCKIDGLQTGACQAHALHMSDRALISTCIILSRRHENTSSKDASIL